MAVRTTEQAVKALLLKHYDEEDEPELTAFILTASIEVDWLESQDSASQLNSSRKERIEAFLACHFYAHAEQLLKQEQKGGASGTYQGNTGMGFASTQYGQSAMNLDLTGKLALKNAEVSQGVSRKARGVWLGSDPTEPLYLD